MKIGSFQKFVVGMVFLLFATAGSLQAAEYDHEVKAQNITFAWKVEGDKLAVKLSAGTEGWVAVGFNPVQEMKGANLILGYVKDGKVTLEDDFGSGENSHNSDIKLNGTSDVTLVGGEEKDGRTTIEFIIPLDSGDKNDNKIEVNGETTVLLAYGAGRDSFIPRHKFRTALKINLSTGDSHKLH